VGEEEMEAEDLFDSPEYHASTEVSKYLPPQRIGKGKVRLVLREKSTKSEKQKHYFNSSSVASSRRKRVKKRH